MKVRDYPLYEIYEDGTVMGARGLPLKPDVNSTGYLRVSLCKDGRVKRVFIHRLVAEHFLEQREGCVVNHKDGNRKNNHVSNLEWVTMSENVKDGWRRGRDSSRLHLNFREGATTIRKE